MILAFNTLEEASDFLQNETRRKWTPREIIQTCLDYGIFPHMQILTDRTDLPLWMREGGVAELPFNLDLLSFLSGDGVVHIARRDDIHYKFEPGVRCDLMDLRLSKESLNRLLTQYKELIGDLNIESMKDQRIKEVLRVIRDELSLDPLNLPPITPGKPWIKSKVKKILNLPNKLFTQSSFDATWEDLRASNPPLIKESK